jgi:hypothetical protein
VYDPGEVIEIAVIAELRSEGFSLRKFAACCASCKGKWAARCAELLNASSDLHQVTAQSGQPAQRRRETNGRCQQPRGLALGEKPHLAMIHPERTS